MNKIVHISKMAWRVFEIPIVNLSNRWRFGGSVPPCNSVVYVDPMRISHSIRYSISRWKSGRVQGGDWDLHPVPVIELMKVKAVYLRYKGNVDWSQTGIVEWSMGSSSAKLDELYSVDDIMRRYENIDRVYEDMRKNGYKRNLAPRLWIIPPNEIFVHIARDGSFLFGGGGFHRLAMAQLLGIDQVPVHLGVVHERVALNPKLLDSSIRSNIV